MKSMSFKGFFCCWLLFITILFTFSLRAQPRKEKNPKPKPQAECAGNCFSTEVTRAEVNEEGCTEYDLKVSHNGTCRYDLSHFTVALPCGTVRQLSNSRNWKQEIGKDPTTGLVGFKIDDIPSFGKDGESSFVVNVTICSDSSCLEKLGVVAYKAGQCVAYDTLRYEIIGGGGGSGGGDSTKTCSTLSAYINALATSCYGSSDGQLEVFVQDGKEPFEYRWSTGTTEPIIQNLESGIYYVTISDANGNILTLSKEVLDPDDLIISESLFNPSCSGSLNGSINISVSGGTGSYTYLWSNGISTEDIGNLNAGIYTVTATDSLGCSTQASYLLVNNIKITLSASITKASCGQSTGAVNVTITGGTAPYSFLWSNGAITEDLQNVAVGNYKVMVTDANGCQSQGTFIVSENNTVRTSLLVNPAGCFNEPTGTIDITASGGSAPYTYSWQHGSTSEDLFGLSSGIYRITVTDNSGCSITTAINVPKKSIQVTTQITQPLCSGDNTGSITVTPVDGGTTYTYSWSNGSTTNTLSDVPIGTYSVIVTDASGCSRTLSYTLTQPALILATSAVSNSQCGVEGNFFVDLSVTGGKIPYKYVWSNGAVTQDLQNVNSGPYVVQITDANGCSLVKEILVSSTSTSWTCLIDLPTSTAVCGSVGNTISTAITEAQQYQWSISSSDNSWIITAGSSSSMAIYSVGTPGSTATFTLTVLKNGCTETCIYMVSTSCSVRDNTGGGDPSTGDPCASDTTTTVVTNPVEKLTPIALEEEKIGFRISAYPNPFKNVLSFELTADKDDIVRLEILDQLGRTLTAVYTGNVRRGETYRFSWIGVGLMDRMYFYRYTSSSKTVTRKLFRNN